MFPKKKKQLQNGYIEPDFPMSVPFPPLYFFFRSLYDVGYWMACHLSGTVLFMESDSEGSQWPTITDPTTHTAPEEEIPATGAPVI